MISAHAGNAPASVVAGELLSRLAATRDELRRASMLQKPALAEKLAELAGELLRVMVARQDETERRLAALERELDDLGRTLETGARLAGVLR